MADYRQIHTKIWKDEWFLDLPPDEKLLFIYLFSNESASVAGIYKLARRVIEFETGLTARQVTNALTKFEKAGKVIYRDGIAWVIRLRQYNASNSPKVKARIKSDLADIPSCDLRTTYEDFYGERYPINTVSIPYPELTPEHEHEHEHDIPSVAEAEPVAAGSKKTDDEDKPKPKTALMDEFLAASGLKMPRRKSDIGWWWSGIGELYEIADKDVVKGQRIIKQAVGELRGKGLTIADPNSIVKVSRSIAANGGGKQVVF